VALRLASRGSSASGGEQGAAQQPGVVRGQHGPPVGLGEGARRFERGELVGVGVADFNIGDAVASLVLLTFAGVGALTVTRRPGSLIGWLFLMV
jgi:hypothetical protein